MSSLSAHQQLALRGEVVNGTCAPPVGSDWSALRVKDEMSRQQNTSEVETSEPTFFLVVVVFEKAVVVVG